MTDKWPTLSQEALIDASVAPHLKEYVILHARRMIEHHTAELAHWKEVETKLLAKSAPKERMTHADGVPIQRSALATPEKEKPATVDAAHKTTPASEHKTEKKVSIKDALNQKLAAGPVKIKERETAPEVEHATKGRPGVAGRKRRATAKAIMKSHHGEGDESKEEGGGDGDDEAPSIIPTGFTPLSPKAGGGGAAASGEDHTEAKPAADAHAPVIAVPSTASIASEVSEAASVSSQSVPTSPVHGAGAALTPEEAEKALDVAAAIGRKSIGRRHTLGSDPKDAAKAADAAAKAAAADSTAAAAQAKKKPPPLPKSMPGAGAGAGAKPKEGDEGAAAEGEHKEAAEKPADGAEAHAEPAAAADATPDPEKEKAARAHAMAKIGGVGLIIPAGAGMAGLKKKAPATTAPAGTKSPATTTSTVGPKCKECHCGKFTPDPFKKGRCTECFHQHA